MEEDERCNEESVVFNARISENEMIITIEEYESLRKKIEELNYRDERRATIQHSLGEMNDALKKENVTLKKGIIKFVKLIGGLTND